MTTIGECLLSIYDAALSDQNWVSALDSCQRYLNADAALIYGSCQTEKAHFSLDKVSASLNNFEHLLNQYNQLVQEGGDSQFDLEGRKHLHRTSAYSVSLDSDIWSIDEAYRNRPEIRIGMQGGFLRRSFINLSSDPGYWGGLVLLYGRQRDLEIPSAVFTYGPQIAPHLAKAAEVFRITEGLRKRYNAVLSVLDQMLVGIIVVTDRGDIVIANSVANALLDAQDGLISSQGKLAATNTNMRAELGHKIYSASATASGNSDQASATVELRRRSANAPLVAYISPLRDSEMELEKDFTGALVTLVDPSQPRDIDIDVFAALYDLTKAECRVADLVLKGLSNTSIAEQLGVGPETVKSQFSTVLAKTNCRNRVAFIWRVFQILPPIK